jgi:hypothetical protein
MKPTHYKEIIKQKSILFCMFFFVMMSCTDKPPIPDWNEVVKWTTPTTTADPYPSSNPRQLVYSLNLSMGHSAQNCTGCATVDGQSVHISCRGAGNECKVTSACVIYIEDGLSILPSNTHTYEAYSLSEELLEELGLYDDFSDDELFPFPDRSFWIIGDQIDWRVRWMNIPAGLVKRDHNDRMLRYEGITFSAQPKFNND